MTGERFFLDTAFVQALLNRKDQFHSQAIALTTRIRTAEIWTTEAVLIEIANALSAIDRAGAARFIEQAYTTTSVHVVSVDTSLLRRALELYRSRTDKSWGMTDCISFVVMRDCQLQDALTSDAHFVQAGFRILMSI